MPSFDYLDARVPVRPSIPKAHRQAWERLSRAGSWWTGAERIVIAEEARRAANCALCTERKAAVSPTAVQGAHDGESTLPDAVVDVIHRIVTDPARLTKSWYGSVIAAGLADGHYVELVGVVVAVLSIDTFHRGLGVALEELPAPKAGTPNGETPQGLEHGVAWVPMIPGRVGNVVRALSLVPGAVEQLEELSAVHYVAMKDVGNVSASMPGLARGQVELIAGRISALNECFY